VRPWPEGVLSRVPVDFALYDMARNVLLRASVHWIVILIKHPLSRI